MNKYRKYIFNYGILSVLHVLKHYEEQENYEECAEIINAINYLNETLDAELPSVITEEYVKFVVSKFKESVAFAKNVPRCYEWYAQDIIQLNEISR